MVRTKGKRFGIDAGSGAEIIMPSAKTQQQKTFSNIGRPEDAPGLSQGMGSYKKPDVVKVGTISTPSPVSTPTTFSSYAVTETTPMPSSTDATSGSKSSKESGNKYYTAVELNSSNTAIASSPISGRYLVLLLLTLTKQQLL